MLISIVLTIVFACFTLFVAGLCLGRWMRPSSGSATNMTNDLQGIANRAR